MTKETDNAQNVLAAAAITAEGVVQLAAERAAAILAQHAEERIEEIAERTAERVAQKILLGVGIDISTPEGILRAQDNFRFLDSFNESTKEVKRKTILTLVGIFITGMAGYVWVSLGGTAAH